MAWLLSKLASFIGAILAKLIPALAKEHRKNKGTVRQIGADDETIEKVTDSIRDAARDDRLQPKSKD